MELIRTGLGDYVDHTAGIVAILGIEVVRQNPEFGDRIQIRHHRGASVHKLFYVASVDQESVRVLTLAANRLIPGVERARWLDSYGGSCHHDGFGFLRRR